MTTNRVVYDAGAFAVTIENCTDERLPAERRTAYFVRHKDHGVCHLCTNIFGEALQMAEVLDKATAAVLKDPTNPSAALDLPPSSGLN